MEIPEQFRGISSLHKLIKLETLEKKVKRIREKQEDWSPEKIVWTNGCFDLLHPGHIIYLQMAKQLGTYLIVGLNSDSSVKKNKGNDRPILNEVFRAIDLGALECVDYITLVEDIDMIHYLDILRPDVYAKGGDYTIDTIHQGERKLVESYGGKIEIIPKKVDLSTTKLINVL